jgi:membrane protein implicated in regulation of membrane protease activity
MKTPSTYLRGLLRDAWQACLVISLLVGLFSGSLWLALGALPVSFVLMVAVYEVLYRRDMRADGDDLDQEILDLCDDLRNIHEKRGQVR